VSRFLVSVAVSYRFYLHDEIGKCLHEFDALEVVIDQYLAASSVERSRLEGLARHIPVIAHGLHMSLGSPQSPDRKYLDRVADALVRLRAVCFTEHVAFVQADGVYPGGLLPLEFTEEGLEALIRNIGNLQQRISVPIMLENITKYVEPTKSTMKESVFIQRFFEATGARLLFDLENAFSNEMNFGYSMQSLISELKVGVVGALHLSGGFFKDGLYIDDHGHDIPDEVLSCLGGVVTHHKPEYVIIERDRNCDRVEVLLDEVRRVRSALANVG
jgi:uncharacterized protein (UPF0276 family)